MIVITVCVGSSCYLRGAHKIAETIQQVITRDGLSAKVELQGSFCLNRCREGVAVAVNGKSLPRVTQENLEDLLATHVLAEVTV